MIAPEIQVLVINAVALALAYRAILPGLVTRGMGFLALADGAVALAAGVTVGALFWGSGTGFSLILFELNWFGFWLISYMLMELPLFHRFCKNHGIGGGED